MIDLRNGQITDLLSNLMAHNPETIAIGYAILEEKKRIVSLADKTRLAASVDTLDDNVMDYVACNTNISWWDPEYNREEKQRTLQSAWQVHRTLGTKAAVETAISAIYPNTKVQEWFQYDGEPFHFKLLIDSTYEQVDPEKHQRVLERVNFYKNLRSHLDSVEYTAVPKGTCSAFAAIAPAGFAMTFSVEVPVYGLG